MTIIDNACASYTAWAGRQYEPVPTWAELIRRVHAPLLGWPPLSAYIGSDQQEKILGLSATGQLPVDLWPVQAWVSIRPVIDGWRDYVRGTTHRSSPPRPPASPPRRSHGAAGPAADPRRNGGSDASGSDDDCSAGEDEDLGPEDPDEPAPHDPDAGGDLDSVNSPSPADASDSESEALPPPSLVSSGSLPPSPRSSHGSMPASVRRVLF